MIKAGITGGIGSGKTTCCKLFEKKDVPVYYADDRAKALYVENKHVKQQVLELLGDEAYINNRLNRSFIAQKVFDDKKLLKQLNAIIHPAVGSDYKKWLLNHQSAPYTIKEAAVMIESGSYKELDFLIVVTAPEEQRLQRVIARDGSDHEQIKARMKNQMSDAERRKFADFVIENTTLKKLERQVNEIHEVLISKAQ